MEIIKLSDEQINKAKEAIGRCKSFSSFSGKKEKAYAFTKAVGVKVCPYCNINYIYTVSFSSSKNRKFILRPDIDHFEPKSTNKTKQLEYKNLIPSCQDCNQRLKRNTKFTEDKYLHPYSKDFNSIMEFAINLNNVNYTDEKNFSIVLRPRKKAAERNADEEKDVAKAENNINVFKLRERYQYHKDDVVHILKKIKWYNKAKNTEIFRLVADDEQIQVPGLSVLFPELYGKINNTSLGKLKKDILRLYL